MPTRDRLRGNALLLSRASCVAMLQLRARVAAILIVMVKSAASLKILRVVLPVEKHCRELSNRRFAR